MQILPCTNTNKGKTACDIKLENKKPQNYSSYMSEKFDDIVLLSFAGGIGTALASTKDDLKREFVPKTLQNTGLAAFALLGIISLNFFWSKLKKN